MQLLFIVAAFALPLVTWLRWRSVIHPCVLLSVAVTVLLVSDIAVRGNDDDQLDGISRGEVSYYQSILLCAATGMVVVSNLTASYASRSSTENQKRDRKLLLNRNKLLEFLRYSSRIAWGILCIEFIKILSSCEWSLEIAASHFFGGYAAKPWEMNGNVGGLHSFYQITRIILPFAGIAFASGILFGSLKRSLTSYAGLALTLGMMISHGSKTPIFATIGFLLVGYVLRERSIVKRGVLLCLAVLFLAATTSILYQHRGMGLKHASIGEILFPKIQYRQDDGAYRAIRCMNIASHSVKRWDPKKFFLTTILNPIPRYFWPNKPILLKSFWGKYKNEWVTITLVGELTAMFGVISGSCLAMLTSIPLTFLLCRYYSKIAVIPDVFIYLVICLYCYMIVRSLQNLGMYVYLPAFAILFQKYISRRALHTVHAGKKCSHSLAAPRRRHNISLRQRSI